jgi:hypothetical protein
MSTYPSRHISITVEKPFGEVYAFRSDPTTFPHWASGLGHSFELVGPNGTGSEIIITLFQVNGCRMPTLKGMRTRSPRT